MLLRQGNTQLADEIGPGTDLATVRQRLRAARVVQIQDRRLSIGIGAAEAGRMLRIALDFGGPSLVTLHKDARGKSAQRHSGGEIESPARNHAVGLAHIRQNLLGRRWLNRATTRSRQSQ